MGERLFFVMRVQCGAVRALRDITSLANSERKASGWNLVKRNKDTWREACSRLQVLRISRPQVHEDKRVIYTLAIANADHEDTVIPTSG